MKEDVEDADHQVNQRRQRYQRYRRRRNGYLNRAAAEMQRRATEGGD